MRFICIHIIQYHLFLSICSLQRMKGNSQAQNRNIPLNLLHSLFAIFKKTSEFHFLGHFVPSVIFKNLF